MKWIYEEEIYKGFFDKIATTPSKQVRFSRYAQIMLDWSTTDLSEDEILQKHNYSIRGRSRSLKYIRDFCKQLNPKLYKMCQKLREEVKTKSPKRKSKAIPFEAQNNPF